jgi:hypothetical protein
MLLFIARLFTLCFICFDTDGNEIVTDKQLKDDTWKPSFTRFLPLFMIVIG